MPDQKGEPAGKQTKNQITLNPITRFFNHSQAALQRHVKLYVKENQTVADLGCGHGFYTLPLAAVVGPNGKVYAVDINENSIGELKEKVSKYGYQNIEAHTSSATELGFIKSGTIDFVLANGLLCEMPSGRQSAVSEIKRILKAGGQAYLSLGWPPPLGHVDKAEWQSILDEFEVLRKGGSSVQSWVLVALKK